MSSITPPSFADDGISLHNRAHNRSGLHPQHIAKWISSAASGTSSSEYTGSFVDDGADIQSPTNGVPGFGQIDNEFYKKRKSTDEGDGLWNEDIRKAVVGDIQRTMDKMNSLAQVDVRRESEVRDEVTKGRLQEAVVVPLPVTWGTFIIRCNDGRVIAIDEHGEYDSGPNTIELKYKSGEEGETRKWIRAASTITRPDTQTSSGSKASHVQGEKVRKERNLWSLFEPMAPIPEVTEAERRQLPLADEAPVPPSGFLMTGGASGWPSTGSTSSISSDNSTLRHKQTRTLTSTEPDSISTRRSPPGSWPSPPQSIRHSMLSSKNPPLIQSSPDSWTSSRSQRSQGNVEDNAYSYGVDEQSSEAGWPKSARASIQNSRRCTRAADGESWMPSEAGSDPPLSVSVQNWVEDRVKTVSETSSRKGSSSQKWGGRAGASEVSWDGYERPKTLSEVSVVGSENGRSWTGSRVSIRGSEGASTHRSHRSYSSRSSHRIRRHGSVGGGSGGGNDWNGSQRANVGGWEGEETEQENGSQATSATSGQFGGRQRSSINKSWDDAQVKVKSRRSSAAGWD